MKVKMPTLAHRTANISSSAIREIFKALRNPNIISLAGGSPAAEMFPLQTWEKMIVLCHEKYGKRLYQYGITEGLSELREVIAKKESTPKNNITENEVIITTGAQSAIELAAKVILDAGDKMILESPTFLASIKTFALFEPKMIPIPVEADGINIEELTKTLDTNPEIKLLYLIPNFQNPTGVTLSLEKRKLVAQILQSRDLFLIEDDPYRDLRYTGQHLPTIQSMVPSKVIYIGSLSKIFSPGMRLGYFIAPEEIRTYMVAAKQATDVHTNTLAQALAAEFLESPEFSKYLPLICDEYSHRCQTLIHALERHLPESFSWTRPEGGMFVWVTGPEGFNATKLYNQAIEKGVAYVPGTFFFIDKDTQHNTFRLNFTGASSENIEKAVITLRELFISAT